MKRFCYDCCCREVLESGKSVIPELHGFGSCDSCGLSRHLYSPEPADLYTRQKFDAYERVRRVRREQQERDERVVRLGGWSLVLMAVALAVALLLLTRCAAGAPPQRESLEEYCQRAIRRLPVFYEDNPPGGVAGRTDEKERQLTLIASEVAKRSVKAPLPPRQWAVLLLLTGWHESTFSLRIHAGSCHPHECDGGRARGPFQEHRRRLNEGVWDRLTGVQNTELQVQSADMLLRLMTGVCPGGGVQGTIEAYMGQRCGSASKQVQERMATYRRLSP